MSYDSPTMARSIDFIAWANSSLIVAILLLNSITHSQCVSNYLAKYVAKYCNASIHHQVVLFYQEKHINNSVVHRFLQGIQCEFSFISNVPFEHFSVRLGDKQFRHGRLQVIIDLGHGRLVESQFASILQSQAQLYSKCENCLPFLVVLNQPESVLYTWSNRSFNNLANYRSILVNVGNAKEVYIKPVLDGCYLYPGVFWPKTQLDFHRLQILPKHCNLNSRTLKVSVNNVSRKSDANCP